MHQPETDATERCLAGFDFDGLFDELSWHVAESGVAALVVVELVHEAVRHTFASQQHARFKPSRPREDRDELDTQLRLNFDTALFGEPVVGSAAQRQHPVT